MINTVKEEKKQLIFLKIMPTYGMEKICNLVSKAKQGLDILEGKSSNVILAQYLNVSPSSPSRWKCGKVVPRKKTMKKLKILASLFDQVEILKHEVMLNLREDI